MCPELILWDWNGTLLDDVDLCVDALNRLLAGFGYPQRYDHERYRAIFGFPIEEYYVRAGFDFTKHSFAELAEKYMEDYVPASAACPLADGAIDALEAFKAAGVRQVILSASNLDTLRRQTDERGVTGYFDRLLGLGDIYAKSTVELGRRFMQEEGIDPARAMGGLPARVAALQVAKGAEELDIPVESREHAFHRARSRFDHLIVVLHEREHTVRECRRHLKS